MALLDHVITDIFKDIWTKYADIFKYQNPTLINKENYNPTLIFKGCKHILS